MFARGVERRPRPAHDLVMAVFRCSRCELPLELERVAAADVERDDDGVTGWVVFTHHCTCRSDVLVVSRAWATHPAFVALEPVLARWRWELGQMADADEFLLFVDDAQG